MSRLIEEYLNRIQRDTHKELLDWLFIYSNTLEDVFLNGSIHICVYTLYIDSIKATLVYNKTVIARNRTCYLYCFILCLYCVIGFIIGGVVVWRVW